METFIIKKLEKLTFRLHDVEKMLTSNTIVYDQIQFKKLSREHLRLSHIISIYKKWKKINQNIYSTRLLLNDIEILEIVKEELNILYNKRMIIVKQLKKLLAPEDPDDIKNCFLEIRAATGGDEAAIFAGDLFKMYGRYSENKNWNIEIINYHEGEKGGFKEIIFKLSGFKVFGKMKFESGGHRVQRVPKTESQGRIHTSTCTIAVIPEVKRMDDTIIRSVDLKIDTFRASGAGGQHVNTTDSAIRITHIPTGTVVECQDERSQHKNKAKALSVLSSRIHANEKAKRNKENSLLRRGLLGTGDRSDRNRTYNFPKNRVTDHRINLTLYCLNEILQGNLDVLIEPIIEKYNSEILSENIN